MKSQLAGRCPADMALAAQQHKAAGALFAVLDEAEVPFDWDEQVVKRRIMAPQHDHSQMHLFAKDIQQVISMFG